MTNGTMSSDLISPDIEWVRMLDTFIYLRVLTWLTVFLPGAAKRLGKVVLNGVLLLASLGIACNASPQAKATSGSILAANTYRRGITALQDDDLTTARSAFEQAVKLSPKN